MKSNFLIRTRILFVFIALLSLVPLSRLFLVQVVYSEKYQETADRQYATPSSSIFERGTIFFTRKDGQLVSGALQASGFKLAINPSKISDKELTYQKLNDIVSIPREDFFTKAGKINDPYEEIAKGMPKEEADAISALGLSGVSLFKEKWRFYPGEDLASQTLGFVGYKGDDLGGRYGLERQYDKVLSRDKNTPYVNFFAEVFTNINNALFDSSEREGNIVTTIEPAVQGFLEKTLTDVRRKYSVDTIGGIVMDPKTGAIYAMATKPDFNPNEFSKVSSVNLFANPLVESVLEFGSVVKPLVMASAIDLNLVTPQTKYEDKGSVVVEKKEIFNFDKKARGVVTMQEVLSQSLNTGMVYLYNKLGKENLRNYLISFGIKDKTGIDLPNESSGLVSNILNSPRDIEYANASFGQGIAMTPVSMIRALSVLANEGILPTPHLVSAVKYEDGTSNEIVYNSVPTLLKKESVATTTEMLVNIMDKAIMSGTGKLEHYSIAVKTGTAQVAKEGGGGYYEDRNTHSFFGYFPAYEPRFIVLLYAVNPKGTEYAATTWSNPFLDIAKFLLYYYEVPPDR